MGEQGWAIMEEGRAGEGNRQSLNGHNGQNGYTDHRLEQNASKTSGATATTTYTGRTNGNRSKTAPATALSAEMAARLSALLLPSAVTLLETLVASAKLKDAMEDQQGAVCRCMGQALAQVPRRFLFCHS